MQKNATEKKKKVINSNLCLHAEHVSKSSLEGFAPHLTCPVWRSGGRRSSFPAWSRTPAGRCGRASSDRSGRPCTRPGRRDTGSRRRQTPPRGSPRWGLHPDIRPWGAERSSIGPVSFRSSFSWLQIRSEVKWSVCYLVDNRNSQAEVLDGSLNWFISLSLSEAVVLPSSPSRNTWPKLG